VRLLRRDDGAGWTREWGPDATGTQLLSAVARDAVDLFGGPHAHRIRECASDDCHLVFVDTSRPGRRRWCSMEHCGNRHKVRALRARREEE
jgi:predicted RNA-binding Zn ribbon-like protein